MKALIIIKGTSGSGKTKLSKAIAQDCHTKHVMSHVAYLKNRSFDMDDMKQAFAKRNNEICGVLTDKSIEGPITLIIDDTNTAVAANAKLEKIAVENGWVVFNIILENRRGFTSDKNIPEEVIENQREQILKHIKV